MSGFQDLFNENNISTNTISTENLIVTGTIDLSNAILTGFPVDNVTLTVDSGELKVKNLGINTAQLADSSVKTNKILDLAVTDSKIESISSSKVMGPIFNDINNDIIITDDLTVNGNSQMENLVVNDTLEAKNLIIGNIILPDNVSVKNLEVTDSLDVKSNLINFPVDSLTIVVNGSGKLEIPDSGVSVNKLASNSIVTTKILDSNVTANKLASNSVTSVKILDSNVTTNKIADLNVTTTKIANDAVITTKILDSNVTSDKLSSNSVTTVKILDSNVTTNKLADLNVTTTKIANDAVITTKILDSNVTTSKIADSNVTSIKIANDAVTTTKILDANVTTSKIADSNVTSIKIANDAVTTTKILDANVTTSKIADGSVTSAKLNSNITVSGQLIADTLSLTSTVDSTSTTTGSLITTGGVGIAKSVNIGGRMRTISSSVGEASPDIYIQTPSNNVSIGFSTSTSSNKVMLAGRGASNNAYKLIEWDAWNGGGGVSDFNNTNFYSQGNTVLNYNNNRVSIPITNDSSSSTSGALITSGGMGIAKNLYVGSLINGAIITSGSSISATTTITSGDAITANLLVGTTTPSGSLVSLTTPSNYPGIVITRGSNKRWDLQNGSATSTDDLFINSKNANNSSSTTKLRLGWGSTDSILRGSLLPDSDNNYQLGNNGNRWSSISAASAFFSNNASVITTSPASTSLLTIGNTSNTSNSDSNIILRTGGTSSGNPFITHQIIAGSVFSTGIDNADSDKYKISNSIVLGTNDVLSIDTNQNLSLTKDFGTVSGMPFYGLRAYVRFNGSIASTKTGTYIKVSGNTDVIVTMTNHGLVIGNQIFITFNTSSGTLPTNEIYTIVSTSSANSFQATGTTNLNVSGNMSLLGGSIDIARNVNFVSYIKVGNYIVNFNSPFIDDSYATTVTSKYNVASNRYDVYAGILANYKGCVHVYTGYGSFSAFNSENVNVTVLR